MHVGDADSYSHSEKYNLLMIQAADALVSNNQKHATFHEIYFYIHASAFSDELHAHQFKQDREKCATFALFLDSKF